jgi:hypothetical protein
MDPRPAAALDPATRFRIAHALMSATPTGQSRLRAFFLSLKLERCATLGDLRDLFDENPGAFSPAGTEPGADAQAVARRLEELLGPKRG